MSSGKLLSFVHSPWKDSIFAQKEEPRTVASAASTSLAEANGDGVQRVGPEY